MKKIITKVLLCATLTVATLGLFSCNKTDDKTLYLYNWTYYTPESVIKQFEEEFNCTVKVDSYASNEEMYAKLRAGAKGYDIVVPSQDYASIMISQGMLREIDHSKLTNKNNINPAVLTKATYDPEMKFCVPYYMGVAGIAVNKTKVTSNNYSRSWNIFADKQFAGHATMMDDMREVIGDALVSLGKSVNSTNEEDLQAAKKLILEEWKPNLVKFDAESFGKSFAAGDFWLCQGYAEVVFGEVPEEKWDETIDFFIPTEGGPSYLDSMCILKDAPNYELANEFINFIHRPEIYAKFLDEFHFPCFVNPAAEKFVTTKPMYKATEMLSSELKNDLGEDLDKYNEIWQEIRFSE
ncbi:MAG: extracellular solute-binding protein [Treponema sp.]|nr:extracellular solute-binding protein [Treponema sp.]MBP3608211.1 extracellular solute-binding protein [Treponema sp.]MBQ7882193.1 extracellular solute-binding protein [Treponema sp.]